MFDFYSSKHRVLIFARLRASVSWWQVSSLRSEKSEQIDLKSEQINTALRPSTWVTISKK